MTFKQSLVESAKRAEAALFGGNRPDFLIVGAQKSGTTSLFSYLDQRPEFLGSIPKEVHYFDREDNFSKGADWYHSHFIRRPMSTGLFFEASPEYLVKEKVPLRIKAYNPNLKIIVILREPVARAYSAWNMYRHWSDQGTVPWGIANDQHGDGDSPIFKTFFKEGCPSFSDYIQIEMDLINEENQEEEPCLLRRGLYKQQIERYVELFGWDSVLVLGFGELKAESESVIRKCYEFLGVHYSPPKVAPEKAVRNKRVYPAAISEADVKLLKEFYRGPNEDLIDYLGFEPNW